MRTVYFHGEEDSWHIKCRGTQFGGDSVFNGDDVEVSETFVLFCGDAAPVDSVDCTYSNAVRITQAQIVPFWDGSAGYKSIMSLSVRWIKQQTIDISTVAVDRFSPVQGRSQLRTWHNSHRSYISSSTLSAKDCTVSNPIEFFSLRKTSIAYLVNFPPSLVSIARVGAITTKELGFPHVNEEDGLSSKTVYMS